MLFFSHYVFCVWIFFFHFELSSTSTWYKYSMLISKNLPEINVQRCKQSQVSTKFRVRPICSHRILKIWFPFLFLFWFCFFFPNILETQVKLLVLFTFGDFVSAYPLVSQKLGHTIRRAGISMGKFQKNYANIQGILWN